MSDDNGFSVETLGNIALAVTGVVALGGLAWRMFGQTQPPMPQLGVYQPNLGAYVATQQED